MNDLRPDDHTSGQRRAELFEELVFRILLREFPYHLIEREKLLRGIKNPSNAQVDFLVVDARGHAPQTIAVISRAPYGVTSHAVLHQLSQQLTAIGSLPRSEQPQKVVVALAQSMSGVPSLDRKALFADSLTSRLVIWDEATILNLAALLPGAPSSLELDELERAVGGMSSAESSAVSDPMQPSFQESYEECVVAVADFCSFSRFVSASGANHALIRSVMSRFYRESRRIVNEHGATLDKFMGDGLLFYWASDQLPPNAGKRLDACVDQLISNAIKLADEWRAQIDLSIPRRGLTAGAAMGRLLMLEEKKNHRPIHAIGHEINIAARLQQKAPANTLVISNKLRNRFFGNDEQFLELGAPLRLKNVGDVVAFKKTYI